MPVNNNAKLFNMEDVRDNPLLYAQLKEAKSYLCLDDFKKSLTEEMLKPNPQLKKFLKEHST
jgi:hypothetical protein